MGEGFLFILPWLVGYIVFTAGPILVMFVLSFFKYDLATASFVLLENYKALTNDPLFWQSLRVTLTYSAIIIPLGLVLGLGIALLMNQNIAFRNIFRTIYYLPAIMSGVAVALLWKWVFNPEFGLINYLLSFVGIQGPKWLASPQWALPSLVIVGLWGIGRTMLIYLAGLQNIPTDLYEAAIIDGANPIRRFISVTIPMLSPVILFNVIIEMIVSFQVFTVAYVMTQGGPNFATLFYALYLYRQVLIYSQFGYGSAMGVVLFFIVLLLTMFIFRFSRKYIYYAGQ